ncbi:MAG: VCBS repeat-containing protein [Anaerolineaceae bacterium]
MRFPSIHVKYSLCVLSVLAFCLVSPSRISFWSLQDQKLVRVNGVEPMRSAAPINLPQSADLNGDGRQECLAWNEGTLKITDCGSQTLWQSPSDWQVKEAQITDLNRDGIPEAALVVWRPFQPWPVDRFLPSGGRIKNFHDKNGLSCHVILIGWTRQGFDELWAGSALIRPVSQLHAADLDGDGQQELAALEGTYDAPSSGGGLTVWRWRGFGFVLIDKNEGNYQQIQIIRGANQNRIIAR